MPSVGERTKKILWEICSNFFSPLNLKSEILFVASETCDNQHFLLQTKSARGQLVRGSVGLILLLSVLLQNKRHSFLSLERRCPLGDRRTLFLHQQSCCLLVQPLHWINQQCLTSINNKLHGSWVETLPSWVNGTLNLTEALLGSTPWARIE